MEGKELTIRTTLSCKNCTQPLNNRDKFCSNCSAKIITTRITFKNLIKDLFANTLGWDNKYFFTIKSIISNPGILLYEYIHGTRKKYVHPFTFLAIGMAIAIFIFNTFDEEFIKANQDFQKTQLEWMGENFASQKIITEQMESSKTITKMMLKYFNILVVLLLPVYSFLSFLVYRKPYNYGEHIVINSYIQGLSFLSISILFLISLVTHPLIYISNTVLLICFYTYAYGKLYKLSVSQSILKVFIFLAIPIVCIIVFLIIVVIVTILVAIINKLIA